MNKAEALMEKAIQQLSEILVKKGISLDGDSPEDKRQAERLSTEIIERLLVSHKVQLNPEEYAGLRHEIVEACFGYGPIQPLINDPCVTDIMVNGPNQVFIEKNGTLEKSDIEFKDEEAVVKWVNRILGEGEKRLDRNTPYVDVSIRNNARVTIVIPPIAADVTSFVVRKKMRRGYTFQDLINLGTLDQKTFDFLKYCVLAQLNILITGGTGAGKTTLLNLLIRELVPPSARVVVMEDTEEIILDPDRHAMKMLTRPPLPDGKGEVTLQELVKLALHLRPDRLVIGEIRGEEVFSLLQAINTGHDGSMCTIHANSSQDAIARLEMLSLMARSNIQIEVVRRFIKSGMDLVIHMTRFPGGKRMISQISELSLQGNDLLVKDIFNLRRSVENGKEVMQIKPTGHIPSFLNRLKVYADIKEDFFRND